jgi:putative ABC transport system permease protein
MAGMERLIQELRAAVRSIGRNAGFSTLVVATLALTLGCGVAVLTLVDAVLLRPLPFVDSHELVLLFRGSTTHAGRGNDLSPGNCASIGAARIFGSMACWMRSERTVTGGGEAESVAGARIEPHLFDVLGVKLAQGRKFQVEEMQEGRDRVVILTHEYWQRRFGGGTVLGRQIELDGANFAVVGVLPPGFRLYQEKAEVFTPLSLRAESWAKHGPLYLQGVARLSKGGTLASARSGINLLAEELTRQFPVDNRALRLDVTPMQEDLTRQVRGPIQLLLVTAGLLLAIGLANLTNLFLTRMQKRAGEFAIRKGLGATAWQLMGQIVLEPLLLCSLGGLFGLVLAGWGLSLLRLLVPPAMTSHVEMSLSVTSIAAMLVLVVVAALMISLPSVWRADQIAELRAGTQRTVASRKVSRLQFGLLTAEVACALLLVFAANLLVQSWREIVKTPMGLNPEKLLIAKIPPPAEKRFAFYEQVLDAIEKKPGVRSAAFASAAPMRWRGGNIKFRVQGETCEPGACVSLYREVTGNYFLTLEIPLRRGRYLGKGDHEKAEPVVVVNETFARRFFGVKDAVGQQVLLDNGVWARIVGVVADTREMGLEAPPRQTVYVPFRQSQLSFAPPAMVMVRVESTDAGILRGVTTQPVSEVMTMRGLLEELNEVRTLQSGATMLFAGVALLLAGLGLYGILAYSLLQRRREMGIRIALGASAAEILMTFNRMPMLAIGAGLIVGSGLAMAMTRRIEPLLIGVKATDPLSFVVAVLVLAAVGALACLQPTREALRIPPADALRQP